MKAPYPTRSRRELERALVAQLRDVSRHQSLWRTFADWIECCAISMSNTVDRAQAQKREARYREIVKRYSPEDLARFQEALRIVVQLLEAGPADVLGAVFMGQDLGSDARGQFFTPYEVSYLMAQLLHSDLLARAKHEVITLSEPTCGSGGMVIAMAQSLLESGVNYQTQLHCVAQDIDHTAVHMAYVQLSLLHVPAVVIQGNTLLVEENERWFTPAHVLGNWTGKLRVLAAQKEAMALLGCQPESARDPDEPVANRAPPQTEPSEQALCVGARRAA